MADRSLLELVSLLLLAAVLGQISSDYLRDPILIDPIIVPKAFEEQGYTPQAFADEIRDEIDEIKQSAKTEGKKEGLVVQNSRESFATVNQESFAVANNGALPDIEIPETKLSFRAVVDFLESLLQFRPRHISGEVTILTPSLAVASAAQQFSKQISITVRVTRLRKDDRRLSRVSASSTNDPKDAIRKAAKAVLQLIDPYLVATYEYEVEKDQNAAWYLTTQCQGDLAKWGWLLQGIILEDQHDLNGAIDKYRAATKIDPGWADPYNDWANVLNEQGNYDAAIVQYQKAIHLDHRYADADDGWGLALLSKRDYEGAVAEFQAAIKIDSKNADAYDGWGAVLISKGDYDEAVAQFQAAIKIDPKNTLAYDLWSAVLLRKNDYEGAAAEFRQAAKLDPKDALAYAVWGIALLSKKDYDGAIVQYQQAVKLAPKYAGYHDDLGAALSLKKEYAAAIAQCQLALTLDPKDAQAHDNWGNALAGQKE